MRYNKLMKNKTTQANKAYNKRIDDILARIARIEKIN